MKDSLIERVNYGNPAKTEKTIDQAVELSKSCPELQYGGSVEVREIPGPLVVKE